MYSVHIIISQSIRHYFTYGTGRVRDQIKQPTMEFWLLMSSLESLLTSLMVAGWHYHSSLDHREFCVCYNFLLFLAYAWFLLLIFGSTSAWALDQCTLNFYQ